MALFYDKNNPSGLPYLYFIFTKITSWIYLEDNARYNDKMTTKYIRLCICCGKAFDFDPSKKRNSKASGFYGQRAWACWIRAHRERVRSKAKAGAQV